MSKASELIERLTSIPGLKASKAKKTCPRCGAQVSGMVLKTGMLYKCHKCGKEL